MLQGTNHEICIVTVSFIIIYPDARKYVYKYTISQFTCKKVRVRFKLSRQSRDHQMHKKRLLKVTANANTVLEVLFITKFNTPT